MRRLGATHGLEPGLAVVLVGENPASAVYVRTKSKQTVEAGMRSFDHRLPETVSEADLLALVDKLNADPAVHGILVQLPLPKQIDSQKVLERDRSRKGRRRLSSGQCRPARDRVAGADALHAARLRHAGEDGASPRSPAWRRWCRALQHRRQAADPVAARTKTHGHRRAFEDARPARRPPPRRSLFAAVGRPEMVRGRLDQAGCDGDRRRYQPRPGRGRKEPHRRRCGLRRSRKSPAPSRRCRAGSGR